MQAPDRDVSSSACCPSIENPIHRLRFSADEEVDHLKVLLSGQWNISVSSAALF